MVSEEETLLKCRNVLVEAPAGHGKTHLIAKTVAEYSKGNTLLLTHTHAGVRAMKKKLNNFQADTTQVSIQTISGFSYRYAASYPHLADVSEECISQPIDWRKVHEGASKVLETQSISEVMELSYTGVFVDEYQDCTESQHQLILTISNIVPCRILSDPLQGIFDIKENDPAVNFENDVLSDFKSLYTLQVPHRWKAGNESLGGWLKKARNKLQSGQPINIPSNEISGVDWLEINHERLRDRCFELQQDNDSVAVIYAGEQRGRCSNLSRSLNGIFQCMEPIDSDELFTITRSIDEAKGKEKIKHVLDLSFQCIANIKQKLKSHMNWAEGTGNGPRSRQLDVFDVCQEISNSEKISDLLKLMKVIYEIDEAILHRRELWYSFKKSIVEYEDGDYDSLKEASERVRNITRHRGRKKERCTVTTTLLVKGLEYDHAIIPDGDSLDRNQLYVAMTRGTKSLTIFADGEILSP